MSIKKRIHLCFFALITLFLVYGAITIFTITENNAHSKRITKLLDPALQANSDFNKLLIEAKMYSTNWVFLRSNLADKIALRDIHSRRYPELKSRLNTLVSQLNNKQLTDSLQTSFSRFESIMGIQKQIMNTLQEFEDYDDPFKRFTGETYVEEILPAADSVMKTNEYMISVLLDIRWQAQEELKVSSTRLSNLVLWLIISVVIIGFIMASYMTRIIISPLDKIRSIINDLGKGIIKKLSYEARSDEIGQMVTSVNYLSEKLFATAAFAIKVGNRNYDAQYELLSNKDTLGKAIVSMRDKIKKNETELNLANQQMHLFFTNIDKLFFSVDMKHSKVLQMSPACEKVYGYSPFKFSINPSLFFDVVLPEDRTTVKRHFIELKSGKAFNMEYRIKRKDGSIRWVETSITPTFVAIESEEFSLSLQAEAKELIRIDGITSDITERKQAELTLQNRNVELTKSNMELDKFVYSVSHDLRAPLSSILGVIDISEEETQDELMLTHLRMMKGSIKKLDGFIKDILDYSRNSRLEVVKEEIDFKEVLDDIAGNLKYMSGTLRKVEININIDNSAPFRSDKNRIGVVLNNLVSNAIRYQNPKVEKPFVEIDVDTTEKEACIKVRDNGIGISRDNQQKIFDMFYRVSESSVGSGLGLYIVKETVEKLNGSISVESELGKCTEFCISIPNN